jgi:esterase/lipase
VHLSLEREYDVQLSHTIWELERAVRRGAASEGLRRSLIEAHGQQLRYMEDIAQVPRHQRSLLLLQPRPSEAVLLLPAEGNGADQVQPLAEQLHKRGYTVLATNLSMRTLDQAGRSPNYWQTCLDEAENRYDMLVHWSTRIAVIGVGFAAILAFHLAATRRPNGVLGFFPTFDEESTWQRLTAKLRRWVLRDTRPRTGWAHQRVLATRSGRETLGKVSVPMFVLAEDRNDRSPAGRSALAARKLGQRSGTTVRVLRPGESAGVRDLSPALLDEVLGFLRQR